MSEYVRGKFSFFHSIGSSDIVDELGELKEVNFKEKLLMLILELG